MSKIKRSFEKGERVNPNSVHFYVRKGEEGDLELFDKLIIKDPYLLKIKREGGLRSSTNLRSLMIMRLVKLYNKSHVQLDDVEVDEINKTRETAMEE